MNYALILAGGKGTRMKSTGVPKQFLCINGKPIIIYTIENILKIKKIDKIIIVCNNDYLMYLKDLLHDNNMTEKVEITKGGDDRLNSVLNGINYIKMMYGIRPDDIVIIHDSVRPFTNPRIFEENIIIAREKKAATTVLELTENIVVKNENGEIYKLYPRKNLYSDQSPQAFNINFFLENTCKIPQDILLNFTDLSENIIFNGGTVYPVIGDRNNIKITHPIDLLIASSILEKEQ